MQYFQNLSAYVALLVLTSIWGYNWVVMKSALQFSGPFQFAAIRIFFGALVLFVVMYLTKRPMGLKKLPTMLWLGLLQNLGFTGLLMWALTTGGAGKTSVLTYTMPFWVLILAWPILGEKIYGWQWLAVCAALLGMVCILDPLHIKADAFSMVLALCSGISWALSAIISKKLHRSHPELDLLNLTAWPMLLGSIPVVFLALIVPEPPIVWSPYFVGAVLYNVLLGGALAWVLWLYVLKTLPAGVASMSSMLAPIIGATAAWLQLNEIPSTIELIGMLLVIFALMLITAITIRRHQPVDVAEGQE